MGFAQNHNHPAVTISKLACRPLGCIILWVQRWLWWMCCQCPSHNHDATIGCYSRAIHDNDAWSYWCNKIIQRCFWPGEERSFLLDRVIASHSLRAMLTSLRRVTVRLKSRLSTTERSWNFPDIKLRAVHSKAWGRSQYNRTSGHCSSIDLASFALAVTSYTHLGLFFHILGLFWPLPLILNDRRWRFARFTEDIAIIVSREASTRRGILGECREFFSTFHACDRKSERKCLTMTGLRTFSISYTFLIFGWGEVGRKDLLALAQVPKS